MKTSSRKKRLQRKDGKNGLTLVELLIAMAILILAVGGILLSYIRCIELNETAKNSSLAVQAAKSRMELIKSTTFGQIKATYDMNSFDPNGLNGKGISYIDDSNPEFLKITVSVSWQQKNGRVYGEDLNLNGIIDGSEDGGDGILDSPVELVNYIFDRT